MLSNQGQSQLHLARQPNGRDEPGWYKAERASQGGQEWPSLAYLNFIFKVEAEDEASRAYAVETFIVADFIKHLEGLLSGVLAYSAYFIAEILQKSLLGKA